MDKQQAQAIIKDIFESSFDKSGFAGFIRNLLNGIDDTSSFIYRGKYIPDAYKQYIKTLERIGKFSDGENSFDILVITLQKETSLERARTMQRNFIAWYLNGSRGGEMKDAALAAFVSPGREDWRFSLVKMDYKFEKTKSGRVKVKEEFTPARRWSFLVGANEKSHTAQSRLVNILKNDEQNPTLKEIEKAFDIETVTKEFFLKYRELFLHTKEELDRVVKKDPKVKDDFKAKGVDTVNFAKKLLGQIIFLYFLQKKGWFGVGRDNDWGTGSKHFLRELFDKKRGDDKNFFNDILEPLFYEALRTGEDRKHEDYYYSRFDCKIPFLNGGLFDPIGNYDWVKTDIIIPDKLFSNNVKTKEGDKGTGILDVFDRYNFTVKEDEPLEKEVAIDPELLGKSYEKFNAIRPDNYAEFKNALKSGRKGEENKFNRKFGVYYTPREIVHYMCQQSLINYLDSTINTRKKPIGSKPVAVQKKLFGPQAPVQLTLTSDSYKSVIPKEDVETLIQIGEQVSENEAIFLEKEQKIKKGEQKTTSIKTKLPDSIRKNAKLIDDKLAEITVCDPAVGSGAFPVGMMSEIVRARNVLSTFVQDKNRKPYEFKRRCIEHSLYGVDIDPGAVEIAKLRLWLSLVVDEDDIKNIKPLPNLDYRIMQGNSLISEFMGINFDSDKEKKSENLLFKDETDKLIEQFQHKKDEFLNESNVSRKSKLKEEVDDLLVKIFETKLRSQKADYFNGLKNIENKYSVVRNEKQRDELIKQDKDKLNKKFGLDLESAEKQLKEFTSGKKIKPFFLWNLYFSEVFHNKGGFDVVIANPPYLSHVTFSNEDKSVLQRTFKTFRGRADIYVAFYERGIELLKSLGHLVFITSNKFFRAGYGEFVRKYIDQTTTVVLAIDFGDSPIFDATAYPSILLLKKMKISDYSFKFLQAKQTDDLSKKEKFSTLQRSYLSRKLWTFNNKASLNIWEKMQSSSIPLNQYINNQFYRGIVTGLNEAFLIGQNEKDILLTKNPLLSEIIKPYLRGKNVKRWQSKSNSYIIFIYHGVDIDKYPEIIDYLKPFKNKLKKRATSKNHKWYELQQPQTGIFKYYENAKIISTDIAKRCEFTIDYTGSYIDATLFCIPLDDLYLLSLLNSTLIESYYRSQTSTIRGNYLRFKKIYLYSVPIKNVLDSEKRQFIDLINLIFAITKDEDYLQNPQKRAKVKSLEAEIDQLVYKLYGLTPEEIKIVEGKDENAD